MTFERAYGAWFTNELAKRIKKINQKKKLALFCKQYEDVGQKPSFEDINEISVLFQGGNAVRSSVRGIDANSLPLSVRIVCWEEHRDCIRDAVNDVQKEFNAVPESFTYADDIEETATVIASATFTTPYVIDEIDYSTRTATKKACFLIFSATVTYGTTAIVEPPVYKLIVGSKEYLIEHIHDGTAVSQPSYDAALPQGSKIARQTEISQTRTFSFTLYKTEGDELQRLFEAELREGLAYGGGLTGKKLTLTEGGIEIPIQTFSLTRTFARGTAAAYTLVLGV